MKRTDLLKKISKAAKSRGVSWYELREGANHTVYMCGSQQALVPRHSEINEYTAVGIMKDLEDTLGRGWWR